MPTSPHGLGQPRRLRRPRAPKSSGAGAKRPRIPFAEAIAEPLLFKAKWEGLSLPQQVALKAAYGLPLQTEEELTVWSIFQEQAVVDDLGKVLSCDAVPYQPQEWGHIVLVLGRRSGKALALDTPIATPSGWTTMGELTVGDEVFDETGNPVKVTLVSPIFYGHPTYQVSFSDGASLIADADHSWQVTSRCIRKSSQRRRIAKNHPHRKYQGPVIRTTEELREMLVVGRKSEHNWAVANPQPVVYPVKSLPLEPYLLGAWLGDGSTSGAVISSADKEVLAAFVNQSFLLTHRGNYDYYINGREKFNRAYSFRTKLRQLGVLGNKHIPPMYLQGSVEQRLALLQGLMDTDGYVTERGGAEFYNTNLRLAEEVLELARSLGIKATFRQKVARLNGRSAGLVYTVAFHTNLPVFRLPGLRRRQTVTVNSARHRRHITAITSVPSVPVRCIEVDSPSHLYLAGSSFIPTHNTSRLSSFIIAYEALCGGHESYVDAGEQVIYLQIAQDLKTAKANLRLIESLLQTSKIGAAEIVNIGAEVIELKANRLITVAPPTVRIRGQAIAVCAMDELAVWRTEDESANPDFEVERAVSPALAQFPSAKLVMTSTPLTKEGILYKYWCAGTTGWKLPESHRGAFAQTLVLHAPTAAMRNPRITEPYLRLQRAKDAEAFDREYLAKFADAISGFLDPTLLRASVNQAPRERAPDPTPFYVGALDPAFRKDAFAFTIGHWDPERGFVQDVIRHWKPSPDGLPIDPAIVLDQIKDLVDAYRIVTVVSDQYQLESLQQLAADRGFFIEGCDFTGRSKAKIYGSFQQLLNTKRVHLLDHPAQFQELMSLERHHLKGTGNFRISAPPGKHDDLAAVTVLCAFKVVGLAPTEVSSSDPLPHTTEESIWDSIHRRQQAERQQHWWA